MEPHILFHFIILVLMFQSLELIWSIFRTLSGYNNISINGLTPLSYLVNADNTIIITECDIQASGDFVIPDSINGSDVIGIAEQAFDGCALIKTIQIPESIK